MKQSFIEGMERARDEWRDDRNRVLTTAIELVGAIGLVAGALLAAGFWRTAIAAALLACFAVLVGLFTTRLAGPVIGLTAGTLMVLIVATGATIQKVVEETGNEKPYCVQGVRFREPAIAVGNLPTDLGDLRFVEVNAIEQFGPGTTGCVELDIVLRNSGNDVIAIHQARIHVQEVSELHLTCVDGLGGGLIETSETLETVIGLGATHPVTTIDAITHEIPPAGTDRFTIVARIDEPTNAGLLSIYIVEAVIELAYNETETATSRPFAFVSDPTIPAETFASPSVTRLDDRDSDAVSANRHGADGLGDRGAATTGRLREIIQTLSIEADACPF